MKFRAATAADAGRLRELAEQIWWVAYAPILSADQIEYMLELMYGSGRITAELQSGVKWELASFEGHDVGYLSWECAGSDSAKLHKLYLLPSHQGRGLGQQMLQHVTEAAMNSGATGLVLTVNKRNERALRAYRRAGFEVVEAVCTDIGHGYVMDDWVLRRALPNPPNAAGRPAV